MQTFLLQSTRNFPTRFSSRLWILVAFVIFFALLPVVTYAKGGGVSSYYAQVDYYAQSYYQTSYQASYSSYSQASYVTPRPTYAQASYSWDGPPSGAGVPPDDWDEVLSEGDSGQVKTGNLDVGGRFDVVGSGFITGQARLGAANASEVPVYSIDFDGEPTTQGIQFKDDSVQTSARPPEGDPLTARDFGFLSFNSIVTLGSGSETDTDLIVLQGQANVGEGNSAGGWLFKLSDGTWHFLMMHSGGIYAEFDVPAVSAAALSDYQHADWFQNNCTHYDDSTDDGINNPDGINANSVCFGINGGDIYANSRSMNLRYMGFEF